MRWEQDSHVDLKEVAGVAGEVEDRNISYRDHNIELNAASGNGTQN